MCHAGQSNLVWLVEIRGVLLHDIIVIKLYRFFNSEFSIPALYKAFRVCRFEESQPSRRLPASKVSQVGGSRCLER